MLLIAICKMQIAKCKLSAGSDRFRGGMNNGKVNILLVDDRPDKLLALEAVLEDLGQNIVRAHSGREALRALLSQEFAVILLDVNMPGMDGLETASLIRQRKSSRQTPIIFITAFADEMHVSRGYSLGAVDYILAPVVPDVLRTKVAVFVDLDRKTRELRRQAEQQRQRAGQLQKLAAAAIAVNSSRSLTGLLKVVADTARDIVGSHQAITLFVPENDEPNGARRTEAVGSFSEKYAAWRIRPLRLDACANTQVARSPRATRMTEQELKRHPDWQIVRDLDVPPIRGMLAAPLTGNDSRPIGVVYLSDKHEGDFTEDDEAILTQLAQTASIAIENNLYAQEREANRIKDEFLATLSHELRTPLNAILGWTQLLRMESPQGEVGHGLEIIERNARAQTKLIEDLLDVSRITSGKLRLDVKQVPLGKLIEAAAEAVRPLAHTKGVALEVTLAPTPDLVSGDADRLQQVIWNLLTNAVKFTDRGGHVEVTLRRSESGVRVAVSDTGRGIAPEFLPHVFDRFRQGDSSSTRAHGGLGIGLTIVRHLAELHGGAVRAESAGAGCGSTFTVDLPLTEHALDAPATSASAPANGESRRGGSSEAGINGLRVLVVDDEPDACEVVAAIFRRAGAQTQTAGSTREALTSLSGSLPDVIVSDIAMPDEDGYDLIRAVRALSPEQGGKIPAIALTAYAREEDRLRALDAGFQAHLPKPIDPAALTAATARLAGTAPSHFARP
ncbi:MAG: two-component hybrid sensor and regulator [Phycisphaerales bacterium]|nr:two-component hybrid sensor and regulator [Phycisphaerales bacterium]